MCIRNSSWKKSPKSTTCKETFCCWYSSSSTFEIIAPDLEHWPNSKDALEYVWPLFQHMKRDSFMRKNQLQVSLRSTINLPTNPCPSKAYTPSIWHMCSGTATDIYQYLVEPMHSWKTIWSPDTLTLTPHHKLPKYIMLSHNFPFRFPLAWGQCTELSSSKRKRVDNF